MFLLLTLPNELLGYITSHFNINKDKDRQALQYLSFAHSALLPHARRRLFYEVSLSWAGGIRAMEIEEFFRNGGIGFQKDQSPTPSEAFTSILRISPEIGTYIRELNLEHAALMDPFTTFIISQLSQVRSLSLVAPFPKKTEDSDEGMYDWGQVGEVKHALLKKVFPTITSLLVQDFHVFPFHEIIPLCPNLKQLTSLYNRHKIPNDQLDFGHTSDLVYPPLNVLRFARMLNSGSALLHMIERTRSTLKVLSLGSGLNNLEDGSTGYERDVLRLIGPTLTSLTLSINFFGGVVSDAFHLQSLPCLTEFAFSLRSSLAFDSESENILRWVITSLSGGFSRTHPLARVRINVITGGGRNPTPQYTPHSSLWLQLDDALARFQYLEKVILCGLLAGRTLKEMAILNAEQALIRRFLPILSKRSNFLVFEVGGLEYPDEDDED